MRQMIKLMNCIKRLKFESFSSSVLYKTKNNLEELD